MSSSSADFVIKIKCNNLSHHRLKSQTLTSSSSAHFVMDFSEMPTLLTSACVLFARNVSSSTFKRTLKTTDVLAAKKT